MLMADIARPGSQAGLTPTLRYRIRASHPHDVEAYTQGLAFDDGFLYEGTGIYGKSTLRRVVPETGEVACVRRLPYDCFGEGITVLKDRIIQLTERNGIGFVYEKETLELIRTFPCRVPSWGLTHDGSHLIAGDGSARLFVLHPESFELLGHIDVHDEHGPVTNLNELEFIQGDIYANVIPTDRIARISPQTGRVLAWIDLQGLDRRLVEPPRNLGDLYRRCRRLAGRMRRMMRHRAVVPDRLRRGDVLNGIAYDAAGDRLFVTGKRWPKLFEIETRDRRVGVWRAAPTDAGRVGRQRASSPNREFSSRQRLDLAGVCPAQALFTEASPVGLRVSPRNARLGSDGG